MLRLRRVAPRGVAAGAARFTNPDRPRLPCTRALAVGDLTLDDRYPDSQALLEIGIRSAVAVPIRGGVDRALGVLAVHDSQVRDYAAADVLYLRAVANVLAATIARERAQATLTCLQETTAKLAEARTSREIAEAIVSSGATCVEAAGRLGRRGLGGRLEARDARLSRVRPVPYRRVPLDPARRPEPDHRRDLQGTPFYFRSADEFKDAYPGVPYTRFEAMAVLPVMTAAGAVGSWR